MTLRVHPTEIVRQSKSPLLAAHSSWVRVLLGDIAEVKNGFAFTSKFFDKGEGVPLLRIRDVGSDSTETRYSGLYDPAYVVRPGEIVVGMDGDFRVARWRGPEALLNQRVCKVVVRDPGLYDEDFLLFILPGYLNAIHDFTSSVTVKHLSAESVKEIPVPLPPLPEQHRIVAAIEEQFSRIDAGVDALQRARRNLQRMRATVLHAAVTGRLLPQDSEDEPAEIVLKRAGIDSLRNDGFPPLPTGWEWVRFGDLLLLLRNGIFVSRPTTDPGGIPILRISAVRPLQLDLEDVRYLPNRTGSKDLQPFFIATEDLLFTRYSGNPEFVGACAMVRQLPQPTLHPDKLIRAVVNKEIGVPRFLELVTSTGYSRDYIRRRRRTTAGQTGISGGDLKKMPVPLPPLAEQARIAQEVERQFSIIQAVARAGEDSLGLTTSLRRRILNTAFQGGLVPQDPSDEPASVLIDRIRAARDVEESMAHRSRRRIRR